MLKNLSALLIAVSMFGSAAAHAAYQSKAELARAISARTGAAQTHIVGRTANGAGFYARSEGTRNGQKYVITRIVSANSGAILRTSGNQLGALKSAMARKERNGAPGGQAGDYGYHVAASRNAMTAAGNVRLTVSNAGFPGRKEVRLVTLTKTGAIKSLVDAGTGAKSRW